MQICSSTREIVEEELPHACHYMRLLNVNQYFNNYIFFCILVAGALVVQTYEGMDKDITVIILDLPY